jgi:hypothetical protein
MVDKLPIRLNHCAAKPTLSALRRLNTARLQWLIGHIVTAQKILIRMHSTIPLHKIMMTRQMVIRLLQSDV